MNMAEPACPDGPTKTCPKCGKVLEAWASICPACMFEWPGTDTCLPVEAQEEAQAVAVFEGKLEGEGTRPVVVSVLIALNVLVFAAMAVAGVSLFNPASQDLFRWGANFAPATLHGQAWRMLTSTFVHVGVVHLIFNMLVLWAGGVRMEKILGHAGFTITYLLSGLMGSVATLAVHPMSVGAGASGAIFGIYGALLGFLIQDRSSIPPAVFKAMGKGTLVFLGYNLVFSLKPGVDLSAHLGGLVAGILCGLALSRPDRGGRGSGRFRNQGATLLGGLLILGGLMAWVARSDEGRVSGAATSFEDAIIAEGMKQVVQQHFDEVAAGAGIKIRQVWILRHDGNQFEGTVRMRVEEQEVQRAIQFRVEGERVTWNLGAEPQP
jgi:rhomboid protease GluP